LELSRHVISDRRERTIRDDILHRIVNLVLSLFLLTGIAITVATVIITEVWWCPTWLTWAWIVISRIHAD
jgi:hypothetical protein